MEKISAGDLRERVKVLTLRFHEDDNQYQWTETRRLWADAELDTRSNLFSSVGIGARGVTFTVRRNRELSLHQAFSWHDQHCFLTAILPHDHPGYLTVKAAFCSPVVCQKDMDQDPGRGPVPGGADGKVCGSRSAGSPFGSHHRLCAGRPQDHPVGAGQCGSGRGKALSGADPAPAGCL